MRLWAQGIDNNDGGVRRVIQACELSDDDRGVGRGQGIYDVSVGSETTTEAAGARRQD